MTSINGRDYKRAPAIVRAQTGFVAGGSYMIAKSKGGGLRLYALVDGHYMDASLHDEPKLANVADPSAAARALGSMTSPAKKASSAENGNKGGRPRTKKRQA